MKKQNANIWIGKQDLAKEPKFMEQAKSEFHETNVIEDLGNAEVADSVGGNRRDFLKFLGFGLGAATVAAGCDIPVKRAIPYVVKPDQIVPGVATYYASTFVNGGDYCPILVKTREGRPIKIEGNSMSPITEGGTSARAQASVLSLYDVNRYTMPKTGADGDFTDASWSAVDKKVKEALSTAKGVRIVTNTVLSPTAKKAMNAFADKYNAEIVTYDPVSSSAILDANEQTFGDRVIPDYKFDKADVIVSFGADFLGTWISPIEYATGWVKNRRVTNIDKPNLSRHIQVESGMSLTGSNADNRILVKPSEQGAAIAYLASKIAGGVTAPSINAEARMALDKTANELKAAQGRSLVVSNSNNVAEQILVNAINNALGNYGSTISFDHASLQRQGSDAAIAKFAKDVASGSVDVVIVNGANPLYDTPMASGLATAMAKVGTRIYMGTSPNETAMACNIIAPVHHPLESWGDVEAKRGMYSIVQPTIKNLFDTRQAEESLLVWADSADLDVKSDQPYFEYVKKNWRETLFAQQSNFSSFNSFWDGILHDGIFNTAVSSVSTAFTGSASAASSSISKPANTELEVAFQESVALGNGQYASNPWLQEMPDPVTRTSWGNYLAVPVDFDGVSSMVGLNGLEDGDLATLTVGDQVYTVPVIQQFGQMPGTVTIHLGQGRTVAGNTGSGIGVDVNGAIKVVNGAPQYYRTDASLSRTVGKEDHYSSVQYHHTMGVEAEEKSTGEVINADEAALVFFDYFSGVKGFQGALTDRSIIYNTTVANLGDDLKQLKKKRKAAQKLNSEQIYGGHDDLYEMGHHWGMHVDLNACIGCGACTVACMSENNVPVVGKREVSRHHEMTWLRIDRYYYGNIKNPSVVYQPMMCQHCDNAPCENVCPVNATNHSSEGLNQMTYNRCIGTRYCANNCPYKVRRFNWLDYTTADLFPGNQPTVNGEEIPFGADNLTRMVLNPDVTVRSRGVIEKCSFCVQRIQEGKLTSKVEKRALRDSDVRTACQTSCPTGAITFGDMNNKKGELSKKLESPLNYIALEEINVRSSVTYTMKVNNKDESYDA